MGYMKIAEECHLLILAFVIFLVKNQIYRILGQSDIVRRPTSAANVYYENGMYLLKEVNTDDFITSMRAIYPPFCEDTGEHDSFIVHVSVPNIGADVGTLLYLVSHFGRAHRMGM
ncbi:unnamed protein product [Cylicostephanus goldi]|uniref:Uncharacterized protein n=1 Tax=Cylicostephanus goldi TaxID=71465 RepID=A0A3P7PL90_CYLGO|nr:unnamed protein product [Cylicostephanus goldi]